MSTTTTTTTTSPWRVSMDFFVNGIAHGTPDSPRIGGRPPLYASRPTSRPPPLREPGYGTTVACQVCLGNSFHLGCDTLFLVASSACTMWRWKHKIKTNNNVNIHECSIITRQIVVMRHDHTHPDLFLYGNEENQEKE